MFVFILFLIEGNIFFNWKTRTCLERVKVRPSRGGGSYYFVEELEIGEGSYQLKGREVRSPLCNKSPTNWINPLSLLVSLSSFYFFCIYLFLFFKAPLPSILLFVFPFYLNYRVGDNCRLGVFWETIDYLSQVNRTLSNPAPSCCCCVVLSLLTFRFSRTLWEIGLLCVFYSLFIYKLYKYIYIWALENESCISTIFSCS